MNREQHERERGLAFSFLLLLDTARQWEGIGLTGLGVAVCHEADIGHNVPVK